MWKWMNVCCCFLCVSVSLWCVFVIVCKYVFVNVCRHTCVWELCVHVFAIFIVGSIDCLCL